MLTHNHSVLLTCIFISGNSSNTFHCHKFGYNVKIIVSEHFFFCRSIVVVRRDANLVSFLYTYKDGLPESTLPFSIHSGRIHKSDGRAKCVEMPLMN